jgi:hypothetical protein
MKVKLIEAHFYFFAYFNAIGILFHAHLATELFLPRGDFMVDFCSCGIRRDARYFVNSKSTVN